jgi:hypothetical protein
MKKLHIKDKLEEIGVSVDSIVLGDFDRLGEFCAKRERSSNDPNYKKYGLYYRSNYERGILIYYLIRQFNLSSMLEIGFGRGYGTFCAAKAFHDAGIVGKVTTVDPNFDERFMSALNQVLPKEWFNYVQFAKGTSSDVIPQLNQEYDLVYVDGDHSYLGTKSDWENVRSRFNSFCLFDDYHLPSKDDPGIRCRDAIDEIIEDDIKCNEKELILMDRLIFNDDKRDVVRDYGQVLLTKQGIKRDDW